MAGFCQWVGTARQPHQPGCARVWRVYTARWAAHDHAGKDRRARAAGWPGGAGTWLRQSESAMVASSLHGYKGNWVNIANAIQRVRYKKNISRPAGL